MLGPQKVHLNIVQLLAEIDQLLIVENCCKLTGQHLSYQEQENNSVEGKKGQQIPSFNSGLTITIVCMLDYVGNH